MSAPFYTDAYRKQTLPTFGFHTLNKSINWERVRTLNLERIEKKTDSKLLLTVLDDVALGAIQPEGNYSTYYLLITI